MERAGLKRGILYSAITVLLILADQITKWVITQRVPCGYAFTVIPDFFDISHVLNTGAAWGVLQGRTAILSLVTFLACVVIVYLLVVTVNPWLAASFIMILSGALGNLIDRVFRGEVVDFLTFHFGRYDFPSFNVADICITCGCILLVIVVVFIAKDGNFLFREDSIAHRWFGSDKKSDASAETGSDNASE